MAMLDYQMILFPKGNLAELTEDGMDFTGPFFFHFDQAVKLLKKMDHVKNENLSKSWYPSDDECYFTYDDGKNKVEIEFNSGTRTEHADIISIRTSIFRVDGSIVDALKICKIVSASLNLTCWNMKLGKSMDLSNGQDVEITINHFEKLRRKRL